MDRSRTSVLRKACMALVACALALVATTGLAACGGKSDEDQVKDYVTSYLDTFKNLDDSVADSVEDQLASDSDISQYVQDGTIDVNEFLDHTLGRFDYKIDSVSVDGDQAEVLATVSNPDVSAALSAASQDVYSMDADELESIYVNEGESGIVKKMFELYYEEVDDADVEELGQITIKLQKGDDGWEFASDDDSETQISNLVFG